LKRPRTVFVVAAFRVKQLSYFAAQQEDFLFRFHLINLRDGSYSWHCFNPFGLVLLLVGCEDFNIAASKLQ
jgi:hypothetical protein